MVAIPEGALGIGFDDLGFAAGIGRVLAPAGRTGTLALVDPGTRTVTSIAGFSKTASWGGGHDEGPTSADEARDLVAVTDRSSELLDLVDPVAQKIVGSTKLGAGPDYVRFVSKTNELWVTEPDSERIELFRLDPPRALAKAGSIAVKGGPESLVIDVPRGRAYTHLWEGATVTIDLAAHKSVSTWPNGCKGSRGIALDAETGFVLVGCAEGKAVVLDAPHGGKILSSIDVGAGVDVIAFSPRLRHLYVPSAITATLSMLDVSRDGRLSLIATRATAEGAHCVAADERGNAWVCDPRGGRLLVIHDPSAPKP